MTYPCVVCPHCGKEIEISQALTHSIEEKIARRFEEDYRKRLSETESRLKESESAERQLRKERQDLLARESQLDLEVARKVEEERGKIAAVVEQRVAEARKAAGEKAREELKVELETAGKELEEERGKVRELSRRELSLLKEKKELADRAERLDLEVARKIDEERKSIASEVATRKDEEYRLREAEKEHKISDLLKQIDELKRRAEQGSVQSQGEVQELELESILRSEFSGDNVVEISKGVRGGDCMQEVFTSGGKPCGKILWESKRTRNWSNAWVDKLKEDQREAKADIAVIVSQALPDGLRHVGHLGGIWVCDFPSAVGMAHILRAGLVEVAGARASVVGKNEKMEMLFEYLSGVEFRNAVQGVIESFGQMKDDLESEKRAVERQWAKREKQAARAIVNMARMYGGIQGIVGKSLPTISALELPEGEEE